jgi:hypothetical protein
MTMATKEVKMAKKAELQPLRNREVHDYQWGVLCALVGGYVSKNHIGELTAWGMLADAFDKADEVAGELRYEVIENRLDLRTAVEKLDCGSTLIGLACDLFIKQDSRVY